MMWILQIGGGGMAEFIGLTMGQLLMLTGIGVVLLVILFVLVTVLKLTKALLKLGCLGVVVLLIIAYFVLRALA